MVYLQNENIKKYLQSLHFNATLENKKILVVVGDSWTNNLYLEENERWAYKLGLLKGYDIVFNISTNYGSNEEIFTNLLNFFNFKEFYKDDKHNIDRCFFKTKYNVNNLDVIIGWSTPIRDKSSISYLYQPFNTSTIPNIEENNNSSLLWTKYFNDWFNVEYHSYKTQLFILFLQEYFKIHNVNWYSFMGFTPLVEKEFENTKWDLRKFIDSSKIFGLYDYPSNMQEYLIKICHNTIYNDELPILEMQYMEDNQKINLWTSKFTKLLKFKDKFTKRKEIFDSYTHNKQIFTSDGHPNIVGTSLIAEFLNKNI